MAAMLARHQFGNSTGLAMPPGAEDNAIIRPLHGAY
jgi:hypothetical protein